MVMAIPDKNLQRSYNYRGVPVRLREAFEKVSSYCVTHRVSPKYMVDLALRSAMLDPTFLERVQQHEQQANVERRNHHLAKRTEYRHRHLL